jgi:hypothetical protein
VTAENAKPTENALNLKLHVVDSTFDFHASHANISPRTWLLGAKTYPACMLFIAFVSKTFKNLDPKNRYSWILFIR